MYTIGYPVRPHLSRIVRNTLPNLFERDFAGSERDFAGSERDFAGSPGSPMNATANTHILLKVWPSGKLFASTTRYTPAAGVVTDALNGPGRMLVCTAQWP